MLFPPSPDPGAVPAPPAPLPLPLLAAVGPPAPAPIGVVKPGMDPPAAPRPPPPDADAPPTALLVADPAGLLKADSSAEALPDEEERPVEAAGSENPAGPPFPALLLVVVLELRYAILKALPFSTSRV